MPDWMWASERDRRGECSAAHVNTTIANTRQVIDNKTIVSLPNLARINGVHVH